MKFRDIHERPKDSHFGLLLAAVLVVIEIINYNGLGQVSATRLCSLAVVILATMITPKIFKFPNILWMYLADVLNVFVSPIILGTIYFLLITPYALLGRIAGRDELKIKIKVMDSYWNVGRKFTSEFRKTY